MFKVLRSDYLAETDPVENFIMNSVFSLDQLIADAHEVTPGDVVLPRYRTLPFGDLLEAEVQENGGRLINSFEQSSRVRDLFQWVDVLGHLTAPTYTLETISEGPEGRYFVKGQTSSLKNRGVESVFADTRKDAIKLAQELDQDDWLGDQTIALRVVQDYLRLGTTEAGLPIYNERRVFTYRGNILSEGFYWQSFIDKLDSPIPDLESNYWDAVFAAVNCVKGVADFIVIDMAQYSNGDWGVVELNDGCQSGFSGASALEVYRNLNALIK